MAAGSDEEQVLMAATQLNIPLYAPVEAERWALVDQTCQVMFVACVIITRLPSYTSTNT